MAQINTLILIILAFPQALYQLSVWLYWWQDKEYRFDRFLDFLRGNDSVRKLSLWVVAIKLISLVLYSTSSLFFAVTVLVYLFTNFYTLVNILGEGIRRPQFTVRAKRIMAGSMLLFVLPLLAIPQLNLSTSFSLFVSEITLLFSLNIGIFWTGIISRRVKYKEKSLAIGVLGRVKPVVIGITGSYGKSTTKDFVWQLLSSKFSAERTFKNENTDFGIIRRIIGSVTEGTKYFVCEMGAYKRGEIRDICNLVKPSVGILTGIEEQHLSLFGSIENIISAKTELLESLPKGALVLINANNKYLPNVLNRVSSIGIDPVLYGPYSSRLKNFRGIYYDKPQLNGRGLSFTVHLGNKTKRLNTSIEADYLLENLCAAVFIGKHFGMSWSDIQKVVSKIKTPDSTMSIHNPNENFWIIDDSHNSTPNSFKTAVDYLSRLKTQRRMLITPGIIELGKISYSMHRELGEYARGKADKMIVTNEKGYTGIHDGFGKDALLITNPKKICEKFDEFVELGSGALLIKGRMPRMLEKRVYDFLDERRKK